MSQELILVLNCGSSSLKFAIIAPSTTQTLLSGLAECLGLDDARIIWKINGEKQTVNLGAGAAHIEALDYLVKNILSQHKELNDNILAIGHRIVHGGEKFTSSQLINSSVLEGIEQSAKFAPLHNPAGLIGIKAAQHAFPHLKDKNVAVFDTAYHQTMPEEAFLYAIPYKLYQEYGLRRYGFHGTSHYYISKTAAQMLNKNYAEFNAITCHLGNGSSVAAIVNGKSVDTSMGLTPLEGLVMGTRSGDIDPAIIFYLNNELKISIAEIDKLLNRESGLLGLSEKSSDCRYLEDNYTSESSASRTLQVMVHRLAKYIASYTSLMDGRIDALIFTGGIGENFALLRELVVKRLSLLGFKLDSQANLDKRFGNAGAINSSDSLPILVIPTNEELVIAQDTLKLTQ